MTNHYKLLLTSALFTYASHRPSVPDTARVPAILACLRCPRRYRVTHALGHHIRSWRALRDGRDGYGTSPGTDWDRGPPRWHAGMPEATPARVGDREPRFRGRRVGGDGRFANGGSACRMTRPLTWRITDPPRIPFFYAKPVSLSGCANVSEHSHIRHCRQHFEMGVVGLVDMEFKVVQKVGTSAIQYALHHPGDPICVPGMQVRELGMHLAERVDR